MAGVSLRHVTKAYDGTVAVDDATFQVRKGELFFLLGPSGCGKTTILRLIAGFLQPDGGSILFDERPIDRVPPHRRNTGMVFQNYALWPHMTVGENVAYGLRERKVDGPERERRVAEALRTVHMERFAERMPNQLSGGQQQRVALARALVVEPDVVLLDEPLSNLDARLRLEMRREIRRIHDETRITTIYVTHDQKEALSMADRLAVMSMGRVEQIGTPREVYRRPVSRFVAEFIGEANMVAGTLVEAAGGRGVLRSELGDLHAVLGPNVPEAGRRAVCMVRPEGLRLGPGPVNAFSAVVESSFYLGEVEQFVLSAGGQDLKAFQGNPGEQSPQTGQRIDVHFEAADAVILPE
ncbi:MAG: ABC transporter ATP-binding protein [Candidatus Brocadiaceae bacterium]|nr:ABC transporter ATP-binding protein [Candidatus Brocadiaceae bacterium]